MDKSDEVPAPRRALRLLVRGFLVWVFVYLTLQGQDGYFARTADHVDSLWLKLSFLNVPVHLVLTFATVVCAESERPGVWRLGLWIGGVNAVLILGHVALSIATAA